jgi:hypothetical protein
MRIFMGNSCGGRGAASAAETPGPETNSASIEPANKATFWRRPMGIEVGVFMAGILAGARALD